MRMPAVAGVMVALTLTLATRTLSASVVIAPPFESLVTQAGEIFVGQVAQQSARWIDRGGKRLIVTDVTFRTEQVIKGVPSATKTLTFLGGIVGETRQQVVGMPTFMVGDRDVLFVRSGEGSFLPLVGLFHGRFRVVTGRNGIGDYVANNARQPLVTASSYASPARLRVTDTPLRLEDFLTNVRQIAAGR
jgi:hypothetical protein